MIGMVYKDFLVMRKQISYYLVFLLLYGVLAVAGVFPSSILGGMVVLVGMMLPMSSFSFDDMARWDKYAAATPAGRRGMVGGKYLFALLGALAASVLVILIMVSLSLLHIIGETALDAVITIAACFLVTLLMDAFILPLMVKFGAEKARTINTLLFVLIFGGMLLFSAVLEQGVTLPAPPAWLISALPVVAVIVVIGGFAISYFIAQGIMEKKEL